MADYLNIAGRVRTTASDGVAMEAQEVKDLNLNKSQQEVNADVQTELSDRYTKEETYSKEQLDELITTPDVNHVSVVATDATTAVTDVLPATGEANTIYRVGNWNGTQYDSTMYALYAWNGSAYVCLAVRSFVGEVYDISVNHPDGQGNPTPYADLTAALGTNGANIPADIRRGGMRIQFIQGTVQSSDNKYVQFFLTKDEWSASEDDWQGVDFVCEDSIFDLLLSDENGFAIARFSGGHIKVKNFDSSVDATQNSRGLMSAADKTKLDADNTKLATIEEGAEINDVNTDDGDSADFSIEDEDGYAIVKFKDGGIETKNFKSNVVNKELEDHEERLATVEEKADETSVDELETGSDFSVNDEGGNSIIILKNGHVKTKNFDSSKISYEIENLANEIDEMSENIDGISDELYNVPKFVNPHIDIRSDVKSALSILDIGNSFTVDADNLINRFVTAANIDVSNVCLYHAVRSSGSFKTFYDSWHNQDVLSNRTGCHYSTVKVLGGITKNITGETMYEKLHSAIIDNKWDLIVIHQVSTYSNKYDLWEGDGNGGYLTEFLRILKTYQPQATIAFLFAHCSWNKSNNGDTEAYFNDISNTVKKFSKDYGVDFIIPVGAAIENLRASENLKSLYPNVAHGYSRDGDHLGYGLARYVAAATYFQSIFGKRNGVSVFGSTFDTYTVTESEISDVKYPNECIDVDSSNASIAQICALMACNDIYGVHNPDNIINTI